MMQTVKLAYVVPTMDRPVDLGKLLDSLARQTRMPDQIIIVDGSNPPIKFVCDNHPDLPITYVREFPPSLARQRNAGMAMLHGDITVAGYLDDDIVLEPESTAQMAGFWERAGEEVGGASFTIINQEVAGREKLLSFFKMHGPVPGSVLSSSFPVQIPFVESTIETQWLYGGATMWRRAVIDDISYDEWFEGHGFLEDLDYSFRVNQTWRLYVVAEARVWHFSSEISPKKQYAFGRQQTFNRLYFARKFPFFRSVDVAWGLFGTLLMNGLALVRHPDRPRLDRVWGNLRGLVAGLTRRQAPFKGVWKD